MRMFKVAVAAMVAVAAVGLSACATTLDTQVTRYQAMPAPQGQTFTVEPDGGMAREGGLEFQRYAGVVAQQLAARGYVPAADAHSAQMIVRLGYRVDHGQVEYVGDPFGPSAFGAYWGRGNFFYPHFGWGSGFYYGWNDPFWSGGIDSYIEYHSEVDLHIRQAGTNAPLFDGRAQARSTTNRLDVLLPNLIEALFTGFPGQNGETIKITIPTKPGSGH